MTEGVAYHDEIAEQWDRRYESGGFARRAAFFRSRILPLLGSQGRWLDAACGSGYFSRMLAERDRSVLGVDGSARMIESAQAIAQRKAPGRPVEFQQIDTIESLPLPDGRFDGCICLSALEYLAEPERCLAELARCLKPRGALVVSVANRASFVRKAGRIAGALRFSRGSEYLNVSRWALAKNEYVDVLRGAGFEEISIQGFDTLIPGPLQPLLPPSLFFIVCNRNAGP